MLLALRSLFEPSDVVPALPNRPGRVIKGVYPYWHQRKPNRHFDEEQEIEELIVLMGIDD